MGADQRERPGATPAWVSLPTGDNRHAFAAGYDPSNNRMMVYGGLTHFAGSCMTNEQVLSDADGTGSSARPHSILVRDLVRGGKTSMVPTTRPRTG